MLARPPSANLRPFVKLLWVCREEAAHGTRERVLPTGSAHLVFRLEVPLRTFAQNTDVHGCEVGSAIFGGPRAEPYVRDISRPVRSVGALLAPGAVTSFAQNPADILAHRHTPLEALWGTDATLALERLDEAATPESQLVCFESLLLARLPRDRGVHPAVAHALARIQAQRAAQVPQRIGAIVDETGYSHRRFDTLFREAVGLTPKRYCRLHRFQSALNALAARSASLAEVALAGGYADQAHLTREFREFTGMTPNEYRRRRPLNPRHVPEPEALSRVPVVPQGGRDTR